MCTEIDQLLLRNILQKQLYHIISSVTELHLEMGNDFAEISLCLAVVYLTGGGGGLNGGGRSILQRERERQ